MFVSSGQQSSWQVILTNGRVIREYDANQGRHMLDWTLDLVATGDIYKVRELSLIPPGPLPLLTLPITEPGTAFQFKIGSAFGLAMEGRQCEAQIIGRVVDKTKGTCICYIWDRVAGPLHHITTLLDFAPWHPRIGPLRGLALDRMGIRL